MHTIPNNLLSGHHMKLSKIIFYPCIEQNLSSFNDESNVLPKFVANKSLVGKK